MAVQPVNSDEAGLLAGVSPAPRGRKAKLSVSPTLPVTQRPTPTLESRIKALSKVSQLGRAGPPAPWNAAFSSHASRPAQFGSLWDEDDVLAYRSACCVAPIQGACKNRVCSTVCKCSAAGREAEVASGELVVFLKNRIIIPPFQQGALISGVSYNL